MKNYKLFLSLLLFPSLMMAQFNDCKEYGFNGNLKKIVTQNYILLEKVEGQWELDEDKLVSTHTFYVDSNNNFEKISTVFIDMDSIIHKVETQFKFDNKLKKSYKMIENDEVIQEGTYQWLNDKSYKLIEKEGDNLTETTTILNDRYRDFYGEQFYYIIENGIDVLETVETYITGLNADGHPLQSKITALYQKGNRISYHQYNNILEKDKHNNIIKFAVTNDEGELLRYVVRSFEYR